MMLNFTNTVDRTKVILGNKMVEVNMEKDNTVLTDDKTTTPFQNVRHIPKSRHLPKPLTPSICHFDASAQTHPRRYT